MSEIIKEEISDELEEIKLGSYPLAEQETHINFMRTDDYAEVYTSDKTMITKLDKLCKESPEFYKFHDVGRLSNGTVVSKIYRITDKTLVSLRSKKMTRELNEEQKKAIAERFKMSRTSQN